MFVDRPFELWRYVYWLPGFNFIRVPSRFIILTMLALVGAGGVWLRSHCRAAVDDGAKAIGVGGGRGAAARRVFELSVRAACPTRSTCRRSIAGSIRSRSRSSSPKCRSRAPATWARSSASRRSRCCTRRRTGRRPFTATAASAGRFTISSTSTLTTFPDAASIDEPARSRRALRRRPHRRIWQPLARRSKNRSPGRRRCKLEHVEGAGPRLFDPAALTDYTDRTRETRRRRERTGRRVRRRTPC